MFYLELSSKNVRFDSVSQLTNVFFDDSNKQVFSVRSGGATGITVKSPLDINNTINFIMEAGDRGSIRSIKFSPDNKILAVQRTENAVEFIGFNGTDPNLGDMILHKSKNTIFGFVWVHLKEVALIGNTGVELFQIIPEKKQLKSLKSCNLTINWFSWCPTSNFALLSSSDGTVLTPVLIKQGIITKLPKLELELSKSVLERDVTLGVLYGTSSIFIFRQTQQRLVELVIYMLSGPGLAPKKSHILRLGHQGRFAMSVVDDLVVVHHQASKSSLLFDIMLPGERDAVTGVITHSPITSGKPIKPFIIKLPSLSYDTTNTMECELYSPNWVLFQPNVVIDAKLGCLWNLEVLLEPLTQFIGDFVKLVDFLLRRTGAKEIVLAVLSELLGPQYSGIKLPIIETIFDKLNVIYKEQLDNELFLQMGLPSSVLNLKQITNKAFEPPRVLIEQSDMYTNVFCSIADADHLSKVLMLYIHSLTKHKITVQQDLGKMIIHELVKNKKINALHQLLNLSVINESKALACFLLSKSKVDDRLFQTAMDMLARLNANEIIIEVLLEQGKVVEALRLAKQLLNTDHIQARKYLEAASKLNDVSVFHSIYVFFQQRNIRLRGDPAFLKQEQCGEYVQLYQSLLAGS